MAAPLPTTQIPSAPSITVSPTLTIQPPLSRRGTGPGLILLVPAGLDLGKNGETTDPPPLQKWAEESYVVAQILVDDGTDLREEFERALGELKKIGIEGDKVGLLGPFLFRGAR